MTHPMFMAGLGWANEGGWPCHGGDMPPREAKRRGQAMAREKIQKPGEEEYDMGGLVMVVLTLPPPTPLISFSVKGGLGQ